MPISSLWSECRWTLATVDSVAATRNLNVVQEGGNNRTRVRLLSKIPVHDAKGCTIEHMVRCDTAVHGGLLHFGTSLGTNCAKGAIVWYRLLQGG